jgi:integrase
MSKVIKEAPLTTANARAKLPAGQHLRQLDPDAHLIYSKGPRGGVWRVRWRNRLPGAAYLYAPVGPANDRNEDRANGGLVYDQATRRAREIVAEKRAEAEAKKAGPVITVRSAVEVYIAGRDARHSKREGEQKNSDARRLRRYVIGREAHGKRKAVSASPLADIELHSLAEGDLKKWLAGVPGHLAATTKRRTAGDLRAALNAAWGHLSAQQRELNPTLPSVIKDGLKSERIDDDAASVARENQILTDAQIAVVIGVAREIDAEQGWGGDLFRLITVLAATGARYSQVARLKVGDVQRAERRIMIAGSFKGRGGKRDTIPVPVGADVLDALLPAITGRAKTAVLLEHWRHEQVAGALRWQRSERGRWKGSEMARPWLAIRERAGLPADIDAYALRHSSIVRALKKGLPVSYVAKLHNTSAAMIEKHYARFIATALEALAREAVVPLVPEEGTNVIRLA